MSRIKASLDHKRIRHLIWLVLTVFVLLVYSLQSVAGSVYFSMLMQASGAVSSPPVILEEGNVSGASTVYANKTSAKVNVTAPLIDYVDNNDPDVDSSADKGTHSNFPAQQAGPDSTYDTLTEENTEGIEDYVDNDTSDVDNSTDVGTHSNFNNMKSKDGNHDVLNEAATSSITYENSAESYSAVNQSSHNFNYSLQKGLGNDRLVVVTVSWEDAQASASISSLTFGGTVMTKITDVTVDIGYSEYISLWYLLDSSLPSSPGSHNIAVTVSELITREIYVAVAEYSGVKQSAPDDYDTDSNTAPGDTSITLAAAIDGSVIVAGVGEGGENVLTNTNNIVNLQEEVLTSSGSALGHQTNVESGNTTVGWNSLSTREGMAGAVWQPVSANYDLDLEVQFTNAIDFLPAEKLCIYTGSLGSEDLQVDYWNGTGWENLATDLNAYSCNEYAVSLTSTNFTIRFKDGTTDGDTTQDQWQIDASLLRVEGAGDKEDAVDNDTSNEDGSDDVGTLSNFDNMKTKDGMANLTEGEVEGGTVWLWQEDTSAYGSTSSYQTFQFWNSWTTNSTTSGTVTKIGIYVFANPGNSPQVKLGIYDDSGGSPNNLLGETNAATITGAGWLDLDIVGGGVNISASTTYHLAHITDIAPTTQWRYRKTATPVSDYRDGRVWPNLFDPAGTTTKSGSYRYGAYRVGYNQPSDYRLDQEVQWTDLPYLLPNENLSIYGGTMGDEDIEVDVWNGTGWETIFTDLSSGWNNASITDWLTTSNFTIRFKGGNETGDTNPDTWDIDVALIHIWHEGGEDYKLDLEVQWTSASYTHTNEELCIRTGTFSGSENLQVKVRSGGSWVWVMNLTANQWNNVSITSYLTSSTFTMQFLGGTETGDTTEDSWNIDATLLHVWTSASTWLSGWDKRVKITIDHNDIDSNLSDSPVLVYLSNSSGRNNDDVTFVFDEVGSNRKKIAVTKSDGTTQCYVEIEKWDAASEQAWLWVKVPSISSTADTDLYLYYDGSQSDNTAYVGDKESTPAQNVWDTSFKGVWHLDEDPSGSAPQMRDSTSNNNDGTSNGNMTSGDQVTGKIDGSLDFDGTDDSIQTTSNELKTLDNFTLSVWFKADSTTAPHHILWEGPASQNGWGDGTGNPNSHEMHLTICKFDANNTLNFFYGYEESGGDWVPAVEIITPFSDTTNWTHAVVVMTGAGTSPSAELFLNGVSQGTDTGTQTNRTAWDTNLRIGRPGADERYFDGMIDEVRVLETAKSASWIKASYESGRDDLLDFGAGASEGTSEGTYDYVLRVVNQVADNWTVNLQVYDSSNIDRLSSLNISLHDGTSSNQIAVSGGSIVQSEGEPYNLPGGLGSTIYISMSNLQATTTGTSYLYVHLKVKVPSTSVHMLYVITFEIT